MRILLNFSLKKGAERLFDSKDIPTLLEELGKQLPDVTWIVLHDSRQQIPTHNFSSISASFNWISRNITLPRLLRSERIDWMISLQDDPLIFSGTRKAVTLTRFPAPEAQKNLGKADLIFLPLDSWKEEIITQMKSVAGRVRRISPMVIASAEDPQEVRNALTGNRQFFLHPLSGDPALVIALLKSFSVFKRRLHSETRLVLAGTLPSVLEKQVSTYKYRQDVIIVEEAEHGRLLPAALAQVQFHDSFLLLGRSMTEGIPLIVPSREPFLSFAGDAAIFYDEAAGMPLSEQMMRIYKDETLQKNLATAGRQKAGMFSPGSIAHHIIAAIQERIN